MPPERERSEQRQGDHSSEQMEHGVSSRLTDGDEGRGDERSDAQHGVDREDDVREPVPASGVTRTVATAAVAGSLQADHQEYSAEREQSQRRQRERGGSGERRGGARQEGIRLQSR